MGGLRYLVKLKRHPTGMSVALVDGVNQGVLKVGIDLEVGSGTHQVNTSAPCRLDSDEPPRRVWVTHLGQRYADV